MAVATLKRDETGEIRIDFSLSSTMGIGEDALNAAFDWVDIAGVPHYFIHKGQKFLVHPKTVRSASGQRSDDPQNASPLPSGLTP